MLSKKMRYLAAACCSMLVISFTAALAAATGAAEMTADEALKSLMDGNQRFITGQMTNQKRSDAAARKGLVATQKPYAIILSCSDSRIPPEIIFDKGLGEIFVIRVAGNVPDPIVLGSIEYAAEHIGTPLVMVLGHQRCGAVTAAVDAKEVPEGNLGKIVETLQPAVKQAQTEAAGKTKEELIETAIDDNVHLVAASLTQQSAVLKHLVEEGKLNIVKAKYDLENGKVVLFK
jgi:carbonic anhydrase